MSDGPAPSLRFSILGPLRIERDGQDVDVGGPKQGLLMGALLLAANRTVSVDRLIDLLWGESIGERALSNLQVYVTRLRTALGGTNAGRPIIETIRPGYRLPLDVEQLDLLEFHELGVAARNAADVGDLGLASKLFRRALALPRGPVLADHGDEEFVREEAEAFERSRLALTTDAYECEIRLGRHTDVTGELQKLANQQPLDERVCSLLMLALYRAGQQVEALATFRRLRSILATELGIEPSPELLGLELKILNHDQVLSPPVRRGPAVDLPTTVTRSSRTSRCAYLEIDGELIELKHVLTTIGRMPDRTVVVTDEAASRRHAEIRRVADGFVLVDVGSTNGTAVNGERVSDHVLGSGDVIKIGDTRMVFQEGATRASRRRVVSGR